VAEIGFGTWGMGGWSGSDDEASKAALRRGLELGCNFLDTARAYGNGRSENLIREVLAGWAGPAPFIATKIPPKNGQWPARADYPLDAVFPAGYIRMSTEQSLEALGVSSLDLQQFHVWNDRWATDERWQRAVSDLKSEGLVRAIGISVNRWEPAHAPRFAQGSSTPSRSSTTSSTRRRKTSCSRSARSSGSPSSRACPSTRAASRER
jgi:aryl-alcohol dehydrogenase-like predicted oxidoreductase